jgi:D-glycero-alpha-D-manno-heptose 1-phosphate guanylyltransferase
MQREAIILAGGMGTRLQSVVTDVPKPMAPVLGKPFLEHLITYLGRFDISRVLLSVGHKRQVIQDHFGSRFQTSHADIEIAYVVEEEPLGTGGAIKKAFDSVRSSNLLILNGDTFLAIDYDHFFRTHQEKLSIAIKWETLPLRFGTCLLEGHCITAFAHGTPEPGFINAGSYIASRDIFDDVELSEHFSFEQDFLQPRINTLRPRAYPCDGPFIDIGVPESYTAATAFFRRVRP